MDKQIIINKYTEELKIPLETLRLVNKELKIPEGTKLTSFAREKRLEALKEAISWKKGPDQQNRKITILHRFGDYAVAVAKPGKEAAPDYNNFTHYITKEKGNNPNDMNPQILKKGEKIGKDYTFSDMFEGIENLMRSDVFGLEILGMLLFRAAFMLDHEKNKEGHWR